MSRNIKTVTKILITILMALMILLSLSKTENAAVPISISGPVTFYTSKFRNTSVFCIEKGQGIGGHEMIVKAKYVITNDKIERTLQNSTYGTNYNNDYENKETNNSSSIDFAKGLSYILGTDNNSNAYASKTQLALWAYIDQARGYDKAKIFKFKAQATGSNEDGISVGNGIIYDYGNDVSSEAAYDIYSEAMHICKHGTFSNGVAAYLEGETTIYKMLDIDSANSSHQEILIYDTASDIPEEGVSVTLKFFKEDFIGNKLQGAKIQITAEDNVDEITGNIKLTSNSNGKFGTIDVIPKDITNDIFKLKIKETSTPDGYSGLPSDGIVIRVRYNTTNGDVKSVTIENSNYSNYISAGSNNITIKNKPKINVSIQKTSNSVEDNKKISGAQFTVKFENIASAELKGYSGNITNGTIINNVSAGNIAISEIQGNGGNSNIKITFTEKDPPDGYKIKNKTTIVEIAQDCSKYSVNGGAWQNTSAGSTISLAIENTPLITLGGTVWQDGQKGEKNAVGPDGENNDGTFVDGVKVYLYNANGKYTGRSTTTQNGGKYSFDDVEKTNDGYYVVFEYNGIKYQETNRLRNATGGDSKALETPEDRTNFNNRFTTITAGQSNDETPLRYDYDNGKSILQGINNNDGTNPNARTTNEHFKIQAKTTTRTNTDKNINCGLVEKEVDLGTVMQVDSTTLKINDKTTKYNYGKSLAENLQDLQVGDLDRGTNGILNELADKSSIKTTYLETSDYYYRIEDYKSEKYNDEFHKEGTTDEAAEKNSDDIYSKAKKDQEDQENQKNPELRVFVTYKVDLINQTANSGVTVNELAYYYDENYTLVGIGKTIDGTTGEAINDTTLNKTTPILSDKFEGKYKITVSNINATSGNNSVIQSLYFTFEVNKTNNSLPQAITNPEGLNCANIVEITSYSTNNSLIDRDSEPGNLETKGFEDDTSQSNGLKIVLKTTDRTIKGTVFEDTNKDGVLDENDTKVDNVIVQLIEIRSKASGGLGEYIWQQTVSGSNKVKMTTKNGYEGVEYTNGVQAGSGQYEFKGFIPGNYIIRYIYGDGTTYDFDQDGKIAKYNGQDYKSTKDLNYQAELFNTASYAEKSSVARDNEARRLEVMAYSTMIDNKIGEALDVLDKDISRLSETERNILNEYYDSLDKNNSEVKYALALLKKFTNQSDITFDNISDENKYKLIKYYVSNKTWMAAETSRINVPIDSTTTSIDSNSTTVGLDYKDNKVTFENMNFGLALRPETKLVLEKHITGLKITPNGTGVQSIVDAKADIESIVNGDAISTKGITEGLATIKSTRGNRGFWQVATDVEELAQGAELEVEYTYVIRNDSEEDYLSTELVVNSYEKDPSTYASELLKLVNGADGVDGVRKAKKGHTNEYGEHLGNFYYTGIKGNDDKLVSSRIETLEEALNNSLTFDAETSGKDFKVTESNAKKNMYDTDGNLKKDVEITSVVQTTSATEFLTSKAGDKYENGKDVDYSKTITLRTVLSSSTGGELGASLPSYIAEVVKYSNAAGRRDMKAEPENLSYVHSDDKRMTLDTYKDGNKYYQMKEDGIYELDATVSTEYKKTDLTEIPASATKLNQRDEFWGETIIITKPTGEDKLTPMQIAIITVASVATLGVGIVLIKKFVLKK